MNVADQLVSAGRPGDLAVLEHAQRHTYADLRAAVAAVEAELRGWDLPPGSRVGLVAPNTLFWVASYLAVMRSGHTVVPFATGLPVPDVLARAERVGCAALLVEAPQSRPYVGTWPGHLLDAIPYAAQPLPLEPAAPPAAEATLLFTSGTTSAPRIVMVGHENIAANTASIVEFLGLTAQDRMLTVLPLSYCFGASLLHTHLAVGGSVRLATSLAYPSTITAAIDADECTGFAGVPSTYQLLLRASTFGSQPLPSLRLLQQAGGRLPTAQIEQVRAAQPGARLFVMYGQTEATARLSHLPPEVAATKAGSIGRGIPGVTLRVADESGVTVPAGTVGEIRARGANITHGYLDDPVGTAAKFVDGELLTGDLARADEDGYLYIVDRVSDFLKPWGHRVSSAEVEEAALSMAAVTAAAVVGRPDPEAGEAIVLFAQVAPAAEAGPPEILAHCRRVLAKHMVPHEVRIIDALPLNANGKVVKAELRTLALT